MSGTDPFVQRETKEAHTIQSMEISRPGGDMVAEHMKHFFALNSITSWGLVERFLVAKVAQPSPSIFLEFLVHMDIRTLTAMAATCKLYYARVQELIHGSFSQQFASWDLSSDSARFLLDQTETLLSGFAANQLIFPSRQFSPEPVQFFDFYIPVVALRAIMRYYGGHTIHTGLSLFNHKYIPLKKVDHIAMTHGCPLSTRMFETKLKVKAEFSAGDFAYDWVVAYLEKHRVWNESRSFKVVARNPALRPYPSSNLGKVDGHPDPVRTSYRSKSFFIPMEELLDVNCYGAGIGISWMNLCPQREISALLPRSTGNRNRWVFHKSMPTRHQSGNQSGALLTAHFPQADLAHDWMLEYLVRTSINTSATFLMIPRRSSNALTGIMDLNVTTKQSDLGWGTGPRDFVRYMPVPDSLQRFLFTSPRTGSTWLQQEASNRSRSDTDLFDGPQIETSRDSAGLSFGSILNFLLRPQSWPNKRKILATPPFPYTLHPSSSFSACRSLGPVAVPSSDSCHRQTETAFLQSRGSIGSDRLRKAEIFGTGNVESDCSPYRQRMHVIFMAVRSPDGHVEYDIKETILADAKDFLASEKRYNINMAGIPHRCEPLYSISKKWCTRLENWVLRETQWSFHSCCILLIEDIECAFPSRDDMDDDDEEPQKDQHGNSMKHHTPPNVILPKSAVTLSGLLNVLDSVSSEEGRLTFATVGHIYPLTIM
ncbi:hypothetical protein DFH07DRAFT_781238 [Mycena maculata]|uniref:Uncharacterized protein n=1 Tax=Mycena maculata TaxID=230809 RepID=A0AAD7HZE9_9AGAR|nr:hypothetical protein DFH07DRAFT_781238 [Mycena maculata]